MLPGAKAPYQATDTFDLLAGTVLTKSFGFPADLRVAGAPVQVGRDARLRQHRQGLEGQLSYTWDDAQQNATISLVARSRPVVRRHDRQDPVAALPHPEPGRVPQVPREHQRGNAARAPSAPTRSTGPPTTSRARRTSSRIRARVGLLAAGAPAPSKAPVLPCGTPSGPHGNVEARARIPAGQLLVARHDGDGERSPDGPGPHRHRDQHDGVGVRPPIAAGRAAIGEKYDIVLGHPEQSILIYLRDVRVLPASRCLRDRPQPRARRRGRRLAERVGHGPHGHLFLGQACR